ncbi:MAG: hypothetical protein F4Z21_00750 [Acidobacteria bacterium]|nr:hypothetical protein [Acidobacteriota bacterium]
MRLGRIRNRLLHGGDIECQGEVRRRESEWKSWEEVTWENEIIEGRIPQLSAAGLQTNASLDLASVL